MAVAPTALSINYQMQTRAAGASSLIVARVTGRHQGR
jgi:hypothetical protein